MPAASARYTIRYRFDGAHHVLLVQDDAGDAYIVDAAGLACHLSGARLATRESTLRRLGWVPVPEVSPYHLDELQRVLYPTAA